MFAADLLLAADVLMETNNIREGWIWQEKPK